jgi:8-oxo-dGTP pyrophosphatase MutT (NUDIX family)
MTYKGRAQCIVVRDNKILMVRHCVDGIQYFCTPGGGIEAGETPEQAVIRELQEECCVKGKIIKKISEYVDPFDNNKIFYTFQLDIEEQIPKLGYDPEVLDNPILIDIQWVSLTEICERDRAYLWASGLLCIPQFAAELSSWNDDISYPNKRVI